jgi:proprotein convertase subtilisin/kexin type 5
MSTKKFVYTRTNAILLLSLLLASVRLAPSQPWSPRPEPYNVLTSDRQTWTLGSLAVGSLTQLGDRDQATTRRSLVPWKMFTYDGLSFCHSTCQGCTGSSNDLCNSCGLGYTLTGSRCCPAGQYNNGTTCVSCPNTSDPQKACLQCTSASQCARCIANHWLSAGNCCPLTTYWNTTSSTCEACPINCETCDRNNIDDCFTCRGSAQYFAVPKRCCLSGQFYNLVTGVCENCNASCIQCVGPADIHCTICSGGLLATATGSKCCPANQFMNTTTFACTPCHADCSQCSGPANSNCLVGCVSGTKYLQSGRCISLGFYWNGSTEVACHADCVTCNGGLNSDCLSCPSPTHYLNDTPNGKRCCLIGWHFGAGPGCTSGSNDSYPYKQTCSGGVVHSPAGLDYGQCCAANEYYSDGGGACTACSGGCAKCSRTASNCLACADWKYPARGLMRRV